VIFTSIGSVLWPLLAAGAGYLIGPRWHVVEVWLLRAWVVVVASGAIAIIVGVMAVHRRARRGNTG